MRNLDIQNLLEAFALQASREVSNAIEQGPHTLGNRSLEARISSRWFIKTQHFPNRLSDVV